MNKPILISATFFINLLFITTSYAALIEKDCIPNSGDGLLTFDSDTRLEWHDVSGGLCSLGGLYSVATDAEIYELLINAGFSPDFFSGVYTSDNYIAATSLINLLSIPVQTGYHWLYGISAEWFTIVDTISVHDGTAFWDVLIDSSNNTAAIMFNATLSASSPVPGFSLYYRSAVPIPATLWLFCSGLLGLIGVARQKGSISNS